MAPFGHLQAFLGVLDLQTGDSGLGGLKCGLCVVQGLAPRLYVLNRVRVILQAVQVVQGIRESGLSLGQGLARRPVPVSRVSLAIRRKGRKG